MRTRASYLNQEDQRNGSAISNEEQQKTSITQKMQSQERPKGLPFGHKKQQS